MTATAFLNALNQQYLSIHTAKEDKFWHTYMGTNVDQEGLNQAETKLNQFLSATEQISAVKAQISNAENISDPVEQLKTIVGLKGWLTTFESHAIESEQAKALKAELIRYEGELFEKKQNHTLAFQNEQGETIEASLPTLASNVRASDNEAAALIKLSSTSNSGCWKTALFG